MNERNATMVSVGNLSGDWAGGFCRKRKKYHMQRGE
jgi:hypothetical protein